MLRAAQPHPEDPEALRGLIGQLRARLADSEHEREAQRGEIAAQAARLERHAQRIEQLLEYIELLRRKRFGPRADRVSDDQLRLFDEAEIEALIAQLEADVQARAGDAAQRAESFGGPMSRSGVEKRLQVAVKRASPGCPSLHEKTISPHVVRHYSESRTITR